MATEGSRFRPEQLAKLASTLADCVNPDGIYRDEDRARRRGLTLGNQQPDGMSQLRGWLTPEARATLEAVLAKLAAPGMCNPDDDTPCVDGSPSRAGHRGGSRSRGQRHHDGLLAALRAVLASGELGQHNGLPASIVVTTTLDELEAAAGRGLTGGGTIVPISDVIRLARHAHHYLAIFDKAKPWRCITPTAWPHLGSGLCCTPRTAAVQLPAAPCPATTAKSTTSPTTPPATPPTPTNSPSPAAHTTACCDPAAGRPAKTPRVTPNGSHHRTWSAGDQGPIPFTIRKSSYATAAAMMMTTRRS